MTYATRFDWFYRSPQRGSRSTFPPAIPLRVLHYSVGSFLPDVVLFSVCQRRIPFYGTNWFTARIYLPRHLSPTHLTRLRRCILTCCSHLTARDAGCVVAVWFTGASAIHSHVFQHDTILHAYPPAWIHWFNVPAPGSRRFAAFRAFAFQPWIACSVYRLRSMIPLTYDIRFTAIRSFMTFRSYG